MIEFKYIENKYLAEVEEKIEQTLALSPKIMQPVADHLRKAKGKNIRAAAIIATAAALSQEEADMNRAVDFAVATELLHLATLIHDDIIDQAETRRGVASVQKKFGQRTAVLSGDYLFIRCFKMIAEKNKNRAEDFAAAVSALCLGEMLQNVNNRNFDLTKHQYYKIIAGKTAALFVLSLYGAAAECGAPEITARRLARVGYALGMVFQMVDDLLDFEGDAAVVRKNVKKDLGQGIVTYPLIHALSVNPSLKKTLRKKKLAAADVERIAAEVQSTGGLAAAKQQARVYYDCAARWIHKALGEKGAGLLEVLELVYDRET